jgi:Domain of unknown function (DUF4260)
MTLFLRIENAAVALAALIGFYLTGASWWLFAALILAPDLSFAAYLAGPRIGAIGYNMLHSWIAPALLIAASAALRNQTLVAVALVWLVHIGFDRAAGYGLKHFSGFHDTHLGRIGGGKRKAA